MFRQIENTFTEQLPGDPVIENYIRQVKNACYSVAFPTPCSNPELIIHSEELANEMGIDGSVIHTSYFTEIFSGNKIYPGTLPYAMCYGGHQFGHWAGQLGDGRAINLLETVFNNKRYTLQLKGAGKTPYSRSADGLAVLRSSVREFLCSEAMFHLGVPTTRALALIKTGDKVLRDMMYDGNAAYEPGAIVTRVAPNFIRFGNFQILAAQNDIETLRKLADYTIEYFFPQVQKNDYLSFYNEVVLNTVRLIVEWERVGFVHGVMNTDNMSILGLTIDYGPYGWTDNFDPTWTPNTTDRQEKRYRFGNQINIAYWNLYQLANALFPLIKDEKSLEKILDGVPDLYGKLHLQMKNKKLGFSATNTKTQKLIVELDKILHKSEMDMTLFYRSLISMENTAQFLKLLPSYSYHTDFILFEKEWYNWLSDYQFMSDQDYNPERKEQMKKTNPKYVLRNYMAQMAIDAATEGDFGLLKEMNQLIRQPYEEQETMNRWFAKRPEWAKTKAGCSMLSCSS